MERRLQELQKISRSRSTLKSRIADLEQEYQEREQQLITLSGMYNTLANSQPITTEERPRPRLVSNNSTT